MGLQGARISQKGLTRRGFILGGMLAAGSGAAAVSYTHLVARKTKAEFTTSYKTQLFSCLVSFSLATYDPFNKSVTCTFSTVLQLYRMGSGASVK